MKIPELHKLFLKSKGITTDTRKIENGQIFFALKGDNFDANKFAEKALSLGADYAIIDNLNYKINDRCICVNDTLETLQKLASYHRQQFDIKLIAITGSNGKTTTKEFIAKILSKKYRLIYTKGNLNNHIGLPLTLLNISNNTEIAVIEMGANHKNEISLLCNIAKPNYGLITNIGKAHLEGFGSFEGVISTKNELYDFLKANKATIFSNIDNEILNKLLNSYHSYTYGKNKKANCSADILESDLFLKIKYNAQTINTNLIGEYNFENVLAAICIAQFFDLSKNIIKEAIEEYFPQNNRSQVYETKKNKLLLDAYNANPSSMTLALKNFSKINHKNKVVILGDMLELGANSNKEHLSIIKQLKTYQFSKVFLIGNQFSEVLKLSDTNIIGFENTQMLKEYFKINNISNSFILLKGSRGIALEKIKDIL